MKKFTLSFIGFALIMVAGCSQGTNSTVEETTPKPPTETQTTEPLVVYLNDFDEMIGPLFEQKTGYKVELVSGNGAEVQSRIEAEKGNPNWDVVWLDGQSSFARWSKEGILLEDWTLENKANLNELGTSLLSKTNAYVPTGAHASGVIVYNTNEFSQEQAPKTWQDLAKPEFKDVVGMADPAVAAPAYPFVAWFFEDLGLDGGKEFFGAMFANGAKVYPKNPNVVEALLNGDIKAAALQESNAFSLKKKGEPIEVIWPEEGAPASVRYVGINKQSDNTEVAKAFVEFLLEKETQEQMTAAGAEGYYSSTVTGIKGLSDRPENAKLNVANGELAAQHEAEIKEWFADQAAK